MRVYYEHLRRVHTWLVAAELTTRHQPPGGFRGLLVSRAALFTFCVEEVEHTVLPFCCSLIEIKDWLFVF